MLLPWCDLTHRTAASQLPHHYLHTESSVASWRERQLREEMTQTSLKFGGQKSIVIFLLKLRVTHSFLLNNKLPVFNQYVPKFWLRVSSWSLFSGIKVFVSGMRQRKSSFCVCVCPCVCALASVSNVAVSQHVLSGSEISQREVSSPELHCIREERSSVVHLTQ